MCGYFKNRYANYYKSFAIPVAVIPIMAGNRAVVVAA
jgi:hypothetical protein